MGRLQTLDIRFSSGHDTLTLAGYIIDEGVAFFRNQGQDIGIGRANSFIHIDHRPFFATWTYGGLSECDWENWVLNIVRYADYKKHDLLTCMVGSIGLFGPLTAEGTIIVDGVHTSCYGVLKDQQMTHAMFTPLRVLSGLAPGLSEAEPDHGMHWYPRVLKSIGGYIYPLLYIYDKLGQGVRVLQPWEACSIVLLKYDSSWSGHNIV